MNKKFIPFVVCGDPSMGCTERIIRELERQGASAVVLGIPFSDPTAGGPVIQKANLRALQAGTNREAIFQLVKKVRSDCQLPIYLMAYANVIFSFGVEAFVRRAAEAGIQGLIVPDIPTEEEEEIKPACRKRGLDLISTIAYTSGERVPHIVNSADGFLFCEATAGMNESPDPIPVTIERMTAAAKAIRPIECIAGSEEMTPELGAKLMEACDGILDVTGLVRLCEEQGEDVCRMIGEYVSQYNR